MELNFLMVNPLKFYVSMQVWYDCNFFESRICHFLYTCTLGNHGDLWECLLMLEAAHQQSKSNPQILLLLMKIYGWLGAIDQCTQYYNKLSIKYIQVDTIG